MNALLPSAITRALTSLLPDEKNKRVCWEFGLVSARRIRAPVTRPGWEDYQVVWRFPSVAVRGSLQTLDGNPLGGYLAYYDPRERTWVRHDFMSLPTFTAVAAAIIDATRDLPPQPIPTIDWSVECLPTSTKRLESPTAS